MKKLCKLIGLFILGTLIISLFSACGDKATEGLEFTPMEDGTFSVSGYTGTDTKVFIPSKHNDIEVTVIGEEAFKESEIQSITGGENIVKIESNAFESCYMLKTFDLKGDIAEIYSSAFESCTNLKTITLPKSITQIDYEAFLGCSSLKEISLPSTIEIINEGTFKNCQSLEKISLPENITEIDDEAFSGCGSLKDILLPKTLTRIGNMAFNDCVSLTAITIPESVTYIGKYAFARTTSATVEGSEIGWHSTWSNRGLAVYPNQSNESVNIPNGLYKGKYNSLSQCTEYIYLQGSSLEIITDSFQNVGYKYTCEIVGNTIKYFPENDGPIRLLTYDEKTERLVYVDEKLNLTFTYDWCNETNTVPIDYYLDF